MDETDLEKLDGITNGTAAANKALVADANVDISGLRNLDMTGDNRWYRHNDRFHS